MVIEGVGAGADVDRRLQQYVRRILDLSQGNKAVYFAISPDEAGWKVKTRGFKLSDDTLHELLRCGQVALLRFSTIKSEVKESRIEPGEFDWKDVVKGLRKLYSRNREFVKDYGVTICYIVYGFLVWKENPALGKGIWVRSPLLVAEAGLERKVDRRRGHVVYQASLMAPFRVNESLVEALRFQYDLDLVKGLAGDGGSIPSELEELDELEDALRRVGATVSEMGWRVEREVWIAGLYFGNVGIYYDAKSLLESGKLRESPIIRALCGEEVEPPLPSPEPPGEREIDLLETPLPADRSQCEVLWYAEKGCNLVVHGPPGTGKSQTIANLIARAIRSGRRVLFVAERREAIDVVYDRLKELGLTLPVLRIFTLTRAERDQVLENLYDTMQYIVWTGAEPPSNVPSFPRREYDHERRYFELLTKAAGSESLSLYKLIGEVVLRERELGRWGLRSLADKYYGRGVWREYGEVDELTLQTYWDKVVEFLKLPLTPKRGELRIIPLMVSFLEEVEERLGEISHREVAALFKLTRGLHDALRDSSSAEAMELYLRLDEEQRRGLRRTLWRLKSQIDRVRGARKELNALPSEEEVSEAEKILLQYSSRLKRAFSRDYKALRAELEDRLGVSRALPYEEALEQLTELRYRRYRLMEEEREARDRIREIAQQIRDEPYAPLILPLSEERLNTVSYVVERVSRLKESRRTSEGIKFLERDLQLFKDLADRTSAEDLDSMIGLLERVPESGGVRILLNNLREVQEALRGVGGLGLDTLMDLIEQIEGLPRLRRLIRDVPKGASFQQFKTLIKYLMLREAAESVLKAYGRDLDHRLTNLCRDRIGKFYVRREGAIAREWLNRWVEGVLERIRLEPPGRAYHEYGFSRGRRGRGTITLTKFYDKLSREHNKKRKRMSLRELFGKYLPQILEVKPILMMSPVAVSALLPRDFLEPLFDLVVFDEASQMKVEMALPSIARGRQLITIGDEHQMPPSRYFERLAFFAEEEEEEEELPESLLQACLEAPSGFFRELWLEWYYRGSHESLIAFSNKHFYRNRLIVLPSPNPSDRRVEFVYLSCPSHPNGGCYIEGRGINPCEARLVVRKLLEEVSRLNNGDFTVGIVAMNDRQQDVIEDLIEKICQEPDLEKVREILGVSGENLDAFTGRGDGRLLEVTDELIDRLAAMLNADRIWVRNLESVQGKEADIVILSMTYGKGRDGKLRQRFGPINRKGGERRINVLISRARERMIVVSSMRYTDLRVEKETPEGVKILRDFLRYAEEGGRLVEEKEGGGFESPFEESVYY